MRTVLASCLAVLAVGCGDREPATQVERLELRVSGDSSVDIEVNMAGEGKYRLSHPLPEGRSGSFSIRPEQFASLVERLQPFRAEAVPFTEQSAREFILADCPKGIPFTYDAGGVWIHWIGPKSDQHYLADLGCDAERNRSRNMELLGIVESLPVPSKW
jgi:hypothetical protein